ncbi:MAG: hypothetical protein HY049_01365 [Acidobacteria bacterium]|nr:hypothetical protein [Acidobacteriota bacterium]
MLIGLCAFGSASAPAGTIAGDVSSLAWMAGTWIGAKDGVEMEEMWLPPRGQSMLSVHRDVKDGRTTSFEFLRIEGSSSGLTYWASPGGRPATPFRCVDLAGKKVVFENPEHDFPQRILYWLGDDGSLHAKIEGTLKGKPASEEWAWRRSPEI